MPEPQSSSPKQPRIVLEGQPYTIFAFPPNRDTLGGTAYLIVGEANILIDCPAWDETNQHFIQSQGGVQWLFLTHRGAIGKVKEIQQTLGCQVVIQEQEAYLLPDLTPTQFQQTFRFGPDCEAIWTSGHSPGSACLYLNAYGGVLFTGRHLLPNQQGNPVPLRIAKTFHWPRQLRNVQSLIDRFSPESLNFICPGANTGFLRGKRAIDQAYQRLIALDLTDLATATPPL